MFKQAWENVNLLKPYVDFGVHIEFSIILCKNRVNFAMATGNCMTEAPHIHKMLESP